MPETAQALAYNSLGAHRLCHPTRLDVLGADHQTFSSNSTQVSLGHAEHPHDAIAGAGGLALDAIVSVAVSLPLWAWGGIVVVAHLNTDLHWCAALGWTAPNRYRASRLVFTPWLPRSSLVQSVRALHLLSRIGVGWYA